MDLSIETIDMAQDAAKLVIDEVKKIVVGKDDCVEKAFAAIIAGGHILIEDVPGVGKTTLALAFSKVMGLDDNRVQFTPDVLPADILGFSMYKKEADMFEYMPGVVMCNLLLADEINRTSPKTQSALLEVMEEKRVTVDGVTREVPEPFIVMATQNPKGSAGTQLLPEAQLDRFMISMSMGYPDSEYEIEIAKNDRKVNDAEKIKPVIRCEQLTLLRKITENIFMHDNIYRYIVKLNRATRENSYIELGISPRGTIALAKLSKAKAFLQGRKYVIPEDVQAMYKDVGRHRIVLNTKARVSHVSEDALLDQIMTQIKAPVSYME